LEIVLAVQSFLYSGPRPPATSPSPVIRHGLRIRVSSQERACNAPL
jgi:hypothetical protein